MSRLPNIVRQTYVYSDRVDIKVVRQRIDETDERALSAARRIGIRCPSVTRMHEPDFTGSEYPTWMLGPNAPRFNSPIDVLAYSPTGRGRYTVVVRESEIKSSDLCY